MSNGNKKIFLIALVLIIIAGAAAFWFFFMNKKTTPKIPDGSNAPFGAGGNVIPTSTNTSGNNQSTSSNGTTTALNGPDMMSPGLYQISKDPISGITIFNNKKQTQIRFVDRATGHIFERIRGQNTTTRLTNNTIPKVYEAFWSNNGKDLIMRYLKEDNETIKSFYARLNASSTSDQEISGLFLEEGIRSMSVYENKVLSVKKTSTGSSVILSNFDGSKPISVFSSPFTNWNVVYSGKNLATLYSAPSSETVGSVYSLSLGTGSYKKIFEGTGVLGLASPDGKKMLLSNNLLELSVMNISGNSSESLSIKTLAEKCIWSNDSITVYCAVPSIISETSNYPDSWYRGQSLFNDVLWKVNTTTGESASIADLSQLGKTPIDAIDISIDLENNVLVFKNKQDLSGWAYVLN